MTKQEFLSELKKRLSCLPEQDREERIDFYSEMIDDRMEEGLTEAEAVSEIGSVNEIAEQIIADTPLIKLAKERIKPKKRWQAWEIILLILGSPIWLSLAVAAFAVALSLYAVLWSLVVTVWAVFVTFAACSVGGIVAGVIFIIRGLGFTGIAMIGASFVCAGSAILLFFGSRAATVGVLRLTRAIASGIKKCFAGKEKDDE